MSNEQKIPHISELQLQNFRGFKSTERLRLAPLTFLVGPNSSGKSSIAGSILLAAQSPVVPLTEDSFIPVWIGSLIDLGSFRDTVYRHKANLAISISLRLKNLPHDLFGYKRSLIDDISIEWEIRSNKKSEIGHVAKMRVWIEGTDAGIAIRFSPRNRGRYELTLGGKKVKLELDSLHDRYELIGLAEKEIRRMVPRSKGGTRRSPWSRLMYFWDSPALLHFLSQTERVSSGRSGPLRWYPLASPLLNDRFSRPDPKLIDRIEPGMLSRPPSLSMVSQRQRRKMKEIGEVLADLEIAEAATKEELSAYHSAIHLKDSVTGVVSNLADIGYGASQVMPVAAGCASNATGPLFVEQPEIHLHPKAQAKVAELLAHTSRQRQVIVETHSDHMINRARIMVAEGQLPRENVSILYVARDGFGSRITPIELNDDGEFSKPWPEGFFDERYVDTMKLLKLKSRPRGGDHANRH